MAKSDLNKVILIGNLCKDVDVEYLPSGTAVGKFTLAVNRSVKKGDGFETVANFFDCVQFGKIVESLKQYLAKGKKVAVTGELKQDRWEKDGQKHSKVGILVETLQILGGGEKTETGSQPIPAQVTVIEQSFGANQTFAEDIPF